MLFLEKKPCVSGKKDSIVKHEQSNFHQMAVRRNAKPEESIAHKAHQALNAAPHEKMRILFNIVHMLAKTSRPLSDMAAQNWIGLHLFNDDTRPSGHISRPSQVGFSIRCLRSINEF